MSSADSPTGDVNRLFTNRWGRRSSTSSPDPNLRHMFGQRSQMVSPEANLRHLYGSHSAAARSPDPSMRHMFSERRPTVSPDRSLRHLYGGQRSQPQVSPDSSLRRLYRPQMVAPIAAPIPVAAPAPQQMLPGLDEADYTVFGPQCVLNDEIGDGAFGTVYKATFQGLDVAIKVVKLTAGVAISEQLEAERDICDFLRANPHPNVLPVIVAHLTASWRLYIITEYSHIGDLYSAMQVPNAHGVDVWVPFDENQSRQMAINIARGVQFLHASDIAHGDIKPENILLFPNPAVDVPDGDGGQEPDEWRFDPYIPKLCDFGNSERRKPYDPPGHILFTDPCCTVTYAAPESYTGAVYDLISADVYSIGNNLAAMLLGASPFHVSQDDLTDDVWQTLVIKTKQDRGFLAHLLRPMPPPLRALLSRSLDPSPDRRCSLAEFMADQWFTRPAPAVYEDVTAGPAYVFPPGDPHLYLSQEW